MKKHSVLIIEQHEDHGIDWVVSFAGLNPPIEKCIVLKSKEDAFKLQELIEELVQE